MELNLYTISKCLKDWEPALIVNDAGVQFKTCEILSFSFAPFEKDTLYIADHPEIVNKLPVEYGYTVLCSFPEKEMYDYPELVGVKDKYNFIFLSDTVKVKRVYSRIKKCIRSYYSKIQLSEELFQTINANADVQRLSELLYSYIHNSVYVYDAGFQVLAMVESPDASSPQVDEIGGKRYLADFEMQNINFMHNHEKMKSERRPIAVKNAKLGADRIICMIDYDRDIGHFVVVEDHVMFEEDIYEYLALFQRALHMYFYNDSFSKNVKGFHYEYFLKDLLAQKYVANTGKNTRTKYLDASFSEKLFCFVIETARTPEGVRFENVRDQLEVILPSTVTVVYESQIVGIMSGYPQYRMEPELSDKLDRFCKGNNLFCGISNAFDNILNLYQYYKQALRSIEAGTEQNNFPGLFSYEDMHLVHVANIFSSIEDVNVFCCPQMKVLLDYDKKNDTELAKTLYYFLMYGNTKDAAAHLFVHRNTILYRIRLIQDLIGEDYQDYSIRHYLMMSYDMMTKNQ